MAQKIQTLLTDDLDPDLEATETIAFRLNGASYEIDLNDTHAEQLRAALEPFITQGRRVGGPSTARRARTPAIGKTTSSLPVPTSPDPSSVRAWAKEHDVDVSERGRIKGSVLAQFLEATT